MVVFYTRKEELWSVRLSPFQFQLDGTASCFFSTFCVLGSIATIINPRVVTKNSSICGAPLARQKKNCNRMYCAGVFDVQTNPGKRSCRKRFLRIPESAREVAPFGMPNKMVSRIQRQGRLELLLTPFRTNKP